MLTSGLPFLGNSSSVLDMSAVRPASLCFFGIAPNTQTLQLGGGRTLHLAGPLIPLLTFTNAAGFASVKLSIPYDSSLRGGSIYAQGFVADPLGGFANTARRPPPPVVQAPRTSGAGGSTAPPSTRPSRPTRRAGAGHGPRRAPHVFLLAAIRPPPGATS